MKYFDSKVFNGEAFGSYIKRIKNTRKNELAKSKAIGRNEAAALALSNQTGSLYASVPYFGRIDGKTSQNNDGGSDIQSSGTSTYVQGFVVASRMDSWTEKSFSKNITAGVDFMDNVAKQIDNYKLTVKQTIILAILKGVYGMNTVGETIKAKVAKEFIEKHTYDITSETSGEEPGNVKSTTLNKAIQRAGGDNKNIFVLVIMHSEISTNLENLKLLKYMTYTDADGIERDLSLGTWNGRLVLVDDNMPTEEVIATGAKTTDEALVADKAYHTRNGSASAYVYTKVGAPDITNIGTYYEATSTKTHYTTYVLGEGSVILDDIGDAVPFEMSRNPSKNGGEDTLYVRDRFICGVDGISAKDPGASLSVSNAHLSNGENWSVISNERDSVEHKSIALCKIVSKG